LSGLARVIAVDTNILVQAHRLEAPFHNRAKQCMRALATGDMPWAIAWPSIHEFHATVTHPNRFKVPSTPAQALDQLAAWRESPSLRMIGETPLHWDVLANLVTAAQVCGGLIHDARIAAICMQHGVRELWTADRDFSRFPQLKCKNPLIEA
jgi:uncharacterized protein